jgi:hypothetical protein
MGTRDSFPGVKRPGREADHTPPSSAEFKECVELCLHSPIRLHGVVFSLKKKHRDNFIPFMSVCRTQITLEQTDKCSLKLQLTPWGRVLLEKIIVTQIVVTFPAFFGTRSFVTVLSPPLIPNPEPNAFSPHPSTLFP